MGPKICPVTIFFASDVLRLATEERLHVVPILRKLPHQNISLDPVLSDSSQNCPDLSPMENYNFGWGPTFVESPSSLVQMFYDLQRKLTCCSGAQDASPGH